MSASAIDLTDALFDSMSLKCAECGKGVFESITALSPQGNQPKQPKQPKSAEAEDAAVRKGRTEK